MRARSAHARPRRGATNRSRRPRRRQLVSGLAPSLAGEAELAAAGGCIASAEPRHARMRELVAVAEHGKTRERVVGAAIIAQRERVEAALRGVIQLVALDV